MQRDQKRPLNNTATTRALAEWVHGLSYDDLTSTDIFISKKLLLDTLGCLLVGGRNTLPKIAAAAVRRLGGSNEEATIFLDGTRAPVRDAAFVNAIATYGVGLNGYYKPAAAHPGVSVIPVLLALSERSESDGREFIAAMTSGYETAGRVGRAVAPDLLERGFSPNGTVGTFAATAAAGRMLRLPAESIQNAFGINGSQAAGLQEWHSNAASTGIFHAGRAAQNAIEAIILAEEGLTGPSTVFEGREGFCMAHSDSVDLSFIDRNLGPPQVLKEMTMRPHFGATSTIAPSSAAAAIATRIGRAGVEGITEVLVFCNPSDYAAHDYPDVRSLQGARQSLQFNVALALAHGEGLTRDLVDADIWHPEVRRLLALIRLVPDARIGRFTGEVEVHSKDRNVEVELCTAPLGDPRNPMDWDQTVKKFISALSAAFVLEKTAGYAPFNRIVDLVSRLETVRIGDFIEALKEAARVSRQTVDERTR